MRYRKLTADGDMVFGKGSNGHYRDQPEAVAQLVRTRLRLMLGEWFLDTTDGTPWLTKVLGKYTEATRTLALKDRILSTPGVQSVDSYSAAFDPDKRVFNMQATITTIYGTTAVSAGITTQGNVL